MSPAPQVWRPGRASTFSQVKKAASPIEILAVKSHQILPPLLSRRMMFHFSLKKFNNTTQEMPPTQSRNWT